MEQDAALKRRNYCKDRKSSKVVSSTQRHGLKVEKRDDNMKSLGSRSYSLRNRGSSFTEPSTVSSSPLRSMPSSLPRVTSNEGVKRSSIYQSSQSVRQMKKLGASKGTRNIESLRNSDSSLTFTIIDSLSRPSQEEGSLVRKQKRSSPVSLSAERSSTSISTNYILPSSPEFLARPSEDHSVAQTTSGGFLEICLDAEGLAEPKLECKKFALETDSNDLFERDTDFKLSKSASAKMALPEQPSQSEPNLSKANSKGQISPLRKMFGPTLKSKSLKNPSFSVAESNGSTTIGSECIKKNKTFRESLLQDFSKAMQKTQHSEQLKKNNANSVTVFSPVHLHGHLLLAHKQGMPLFEFSVNDMEDVLSARAWKMDNSFNWVYTFYSNSTKRKSNSNGWGAKDTCRDTLMVGQMHVSCFICSEMRNTGSLDSSMVEEFALYNIAHARKNSAPEYLLGKVSNDLGLSAPWASLNSHPHLEVAAVVIQFPFEDKENFKDKIEDKKADAPLNVKVITPSGTHGLPNTKEGGPSSLLERWRLGGGCDCGGWDMACPLTIFDSSCAKADSVSVESQHHWVLYARGAKEKIPALTMSFVEEGKYSVDFHAQLSSLQAFSICVSLLHNKEVSIPFGQERYNNALQCKSLKSQLQEEVRLFVEAVAEEEKRKVEKRKDVPQYLAFNPPFSPIGRV